MSDFSLAKGRGASESYAILEGRLVDPLDGRWTAIVSLKDDDAPFAVGDLATLSIYGRRRACAVVRFAAPDGRPAARLVGGAGRLGVEVPARAYDSRPLSELVGDALLDTRADALIETTGELVGDLSVLSETSLDGWIRQRSAAGFAVRRVLRYAPTDVVLRVDDEGRWNAVRVDWSSSGLDADPARESTWPTSDAASFHADDLVEVIPGTTLKTLGRDRRVDRLEYRLGDESRVSVWFRE